MRIIQRKKTNPARTRQPKLSRSIPVDRYYSGMTQGQYQNRSSSQNPLQNSDRSRTVRKRQASVWIQGVVKWFGVIGIATVLLFNVTLNQVGVKIGLNDLENSSTRYRSEEEYVQRAQEAFRSTLFSRSKLTFQAKDYEELLAAALPEVELAVAVVPLVGTRLQVGLALTEPLAYAPTIGTLGAVVGVNGRLLAISEASVTKNLSETLPKLHIEPLGNIAEGAAVLTSSEVKLIQLVINEFDGSLSERPKLSAIRYLIEKRELHITFQNREYYAKFTVERDARVQAGAVVATLRDLANGAGESPKEYIDVRVDGRVFVK